MDDADDMAFPIFDIAFATQSLVFNVVNDEMTFFIDGGSNCVVVVTAKVLTNVRPASIKVKVGGGVLTCRQIGDLVVKVPSPDGSTHAITLRDARVLPTFGINIIPECVFYRKGCSVTKCVPHQWTSSGMVGEDLEPACCEPDSTPGLTSFSAKLW